MICIGKVQCRREGARAYLEAEVLIPQKALARWKVFSADCERFDDFTYITADYVEHIPARLWFSVDCEYGDFFRSDRADAFVTALLYYAMATGEDICSESPVSAQLLFSINHMWSKLIAAASNVRPIRVKAERAPDAIKPGRYVGTGMSMGVDSLHTLYEYGVKDVGEDYRLTHLTYFNVGADRWRLKSGGTLSDLQAQLRGVSEIRARRAAKARAIAGEMGLGFVELDSNVSDFYEGAFEESHLFRSCAAAMALSGGFSKYYFSSTGLAHDDYSPRLRIDAAHYEQFVLPCLSTSHLEFINGGKPFTRLEKLERISCFPIAQQYLITCDQETACYHCTKDYRTIIAIEIIGCQQEFACAFAPDRCMQVRSKAYGWLVASHKNNEAARLLWERARAKRLIPLCAYPLGVAIQCKRALMKMERYLKRFA